MGIYGIDKTIDVCKQQVPIVLGCMFWIGLISVPFICYWALPTPDPVLCMLAP